MVLRFSYESCAAMIDEQIGANVARARKLLGLTVEEVAQSCGISRELLAMIESGQSRPKPALLITLAKHLGVTIGQLFGHEEFPGNFANSSKKKAMN
jgi:transcriptional regulator with XRE-family HTH domain